MKSDLFRTLFAALALIAMAASIAYAQPPDTLWSQTYGGVGLGEYCNQVQQTSDGGFIFAGQNGFQGGILPWLVKTDADGNIIWDEVYYEATTNTYFSSVDQTFDDGYVAGGISRANWGTSRIDYYLVKTDQSGTTQWSHTYSTSGYGFDYGKSVQQTFDGGFIFGGNTAPGPSPYEFFLVRTDASGNAIWTQSYGDGGAGDERANSVVQTSDSAFVMAGYTSSYGAGSWDFYLVKVDAFGDTLWTRTYGGTGGEEAFCIQETADNGLIVAGYTGWPQDFYVVRTDAGGNLIWERTYGGYDHDYAKGVKQTPDGGFIIVGSTASFGAGFTDFYIVRTDASGDTLWTSTYGGSDDERAYSVDLTSDGGYIVGGHTSSFGSGDFDVWLIRFAGEAAPPNVTVTLTPHNPPIQIPATGGAFDFDVLIENLESAPVTCDVWTEAILPNGQPYPIILRSDVIIPAGGSILRTLTQNVPPGAPAGSYAYNAKLGDHPDLVYAEDSFPFEKLGFSDAYDAESTWMLSGWEEEVNASIPEPEEFALCPVHPNPFNPTTTISFSLPEASNVNLAVYDVSGRLVTTLINGWRNAADHEVIFNASNLPSGIYIVRLEAGSFSSTRKIVLVK